MSIEGGDGIQDHLRNIETALSQAAAAEERALLPLTRLRLWSQGRPKAARTVDASSREVEVTRQRLASLRVIKPGQ